MSQLMIANQEDETEEVKTEPAIKTRDVDENSSEEEDQSVPGQSHVDVTTNAANRVSMLPLDWTQQACDKPSEIPIRYPFDVADISPDEMEIVLVGTAGQKITNLGPDFSNKANPLMKQLVIRSHLLRKIEGLQNFKQLDLLEFYDNQIESLDGVNSGADGLPGRTLRVLDMSFNVIRDMQQVEFCPNLQELYIANNKLKSMKGLRGLKNLRKLDLGANRIRVMDPDELSGLISLEELWLGKNKIEMIQGLEALVKLCRLDIQSNRLTTIENISHPELLEEMYFAHNAITSEGASIESGLAQDFPKLSVLDLSRNRLTTTAPLKHLTSAEELWLSGNQIQSFTEVEPMRALGSSLQTIYLEYNPLQQDPLYRKKLAEMIPSLIQIDAYLIAGSGGHGIHPIQKSSKPKDPVKEVLQSGLSEEEKASRLQDLIIQRARDETQQHQGSNT